MESTDQSLYKGHHFEATIWILPSERSGRKTAFHNGVRWQFRYENQPAEESSYLIYPDFVDETGRSLSPDMPLTEGEPLTARMTILSDELRLSVHLNRIRPGTPFFGYDIWRPIAKGIVTLSFLDAPEP